MYNPPHNDHTEWLKSHEKVSVIPTQYKKEPSHLFSYVSHNTTKYGSLVLHFESLDKSIVAVIFFNVRIKNKHGKYYPTGKNGQFIPEPMSGFRKFWMETIGTEPEKWHQLHRRLKSNLRNLVFTGNITREENKAGKVYFKLHNIGVKNGF